MRHLNADSLALLLVVSPSLLNLVMVVFTLCSILKRQTNQDRRLLKRDEGSHGLSRGVLLLYIGDAIIFIRDNLKPSIEDWPYRETTAVSASVSYKATLDAPNQEHRSISVYRF